MPFNYYFPNRLKTIFPNQGPSIINQTLPLDILSLANFPRENPENNKRSNPELNRMVPIFFKFINQQCENLRPNQPLGKLKSSESVKKSIGDNYFFPLPLLRPGNINIPIHTFHFLEANNQIGTSLSSGKKFSK